MNLAQTIRRALLQTNQVRQNGTSSAIFSQNEMVSATQDCLNELAALAKAADADWNLITRLSTDSAFTFEGETYTPTTSMPTVATTRTYTLPPDFLRMKRIRCLTETYRDLVFTHMDVDNPLFAVLENDDNDNVPDWLYYDVIDRRTLRFASRPGAVLDLEFMYEARYPFLYIYNGQASNVATVTIDDETVSTSGGTASAFLTERLSTPAEIMFASDASGNHPIVMSQTSTDLFLAPGRVTGVGQARQIASFTTATALEMSATWPFATDASIGYLICSAPELMETHPQLFIDYLRYYIYDRIGNKKAGEALSKYEMGKRQFKSDIQVRATDLEFAEDFES